MSDQFQKVELSRSGIELPVLFAASSPAGGRHLNDHAALADLAVARWFQVQCFAALAVITHGQFDSTATAVQSGRMVDMLGVGLQGHSFCRLPVTIWLADEPQLSVEAMANGVVVTDADGHGVKAVRARPGFRPGNESNSEAFAGSTWCHCDDAWLHFSGSASLGEVGSERAHRHAADDRVAIKQYEYLSCWISRTSGCIREELKVVVFGGDDASSHIGVDAELIDDFILVRANLSEHVCEVRPG